MSIIDIPNPATDKSAASEMVLDARGLTVRIGTPRGELRAVENISFQARSQQVVAIVGESGAGKSVTALSILRLLPSPPVRVAAGEIVVNGRDIQKLSSAQMRDVRGNEVAMIFQEPMTALNPALRIWRQIAEPLVRHRNLSWSAAKRRAIELLAEVQIPDPAQRAEAYPHQFSGGMRQRVMIAIAISCRPRLIIADEPTTALDVTVQAQILSLLSDLTRRSGGALLLITHDLGVVARYADHVNVMYAGRIVETASAEDLYARPTHPYTRALMASIPRLDGEVAARLDAIPGAPPPLLADLPGCAFAPRCKNARPRCTEERPVLEAKSPAHFTACWYPT